MQEQQVMQEQKVQEQKVQEQREKQILRYSLLSFLNKQESDQSYISTLQTIVNSLPSYDSSHQIMENNKMIEIQLRNAHDYKNNLQTYLEQFKDDQEIKDAYTTNYLKYNPNS